MAFNKEAIENHRTAAKILYKIMGETFRYIGKNPEITECDVQDFINKQFQKHGIKEDSLYPNPIVSFCENTALVHYYASQKSAKKLKPESLVLIDIWGRLNKKNAPFADITWMGYYGKKLPKEMKKVFEVVIGARDEALKFIKSNLKNKLLPKGEEVDQISRNYIAKRGFGKYFLHGTGHPLGIKKDHGPGTYLSSKGKNRISKMMAYTIEPGIYLTNKFGFRSEMDFYIDNNWKLKVTTKLQKKIVTIN